MVSGFIAIGIGFLSIVLLAIIVHLISKRIPVRPAVPEKFMLNDSLPPALHTRLSRLGLSPEKIRQTAQDLQNYIQQETQKKTDLLKKELGRTFHEVIESKNQAIQRVETQYQTVRQGYQKLGREKKETEGVVRSLSSGRIVVNDRGETMMVSPEAEKILQKTKEQLLGKTIVSAKSREVLISYVGALDQSEEQSITLFCDSEETKRRVTGSTAVIETESGHTRGMISVLPEATQRTDLEEYKTDFIANFSHELRTPLVCIQKSIQALANGELGEISGPQKEYLGIARRSSEKLEKMVAAILDFSKIEAGRIRFRPAVFAVTEFVKDVKTLFASWSLDKEVAILDRYEDENMLLHADREHLGRVLSNLISNALKFTPAGGKITVEVKKAVPTEFFLPGDGQAYVQFSVQDTGIGIPENERARIFEKFARGSDPAVQAEKGTGLGLAIVQKLLRLMKGEVWVESEPGKGARFSFVIPQNSDVEE